MATPRFDRIAINFLRRVPDEFVTAFTPGSAMPDGNILTKELIANYVNRALNELFNQFWKASQGNYKVFIRIFPELTKYSTNNIAFTNGNYTITSPYFDLYKLIGAIIEATPKVFLKVWDESKYTIALSREYPEYIATDANPAIIQINRTLALFPQTTKNVKIHYIQAPIDPTTGGQLVQNGNYDSPYFDHWNDMLTDIAYQLYLKETKDIE